MVTTDLDKVSDVTNKLSSCVGHPIAIDGTLFTNIWQALSDTTTKLQEGISQIQDSTSYLSDMVEETSSNYAVIQDTQLMFQTTITSLQESIRKHESRFAKILPVLMSVNQGLSSASVVDIDQKLAKLSQAIEELQEKQWQSALTPSAQGFDSRSFAQLDANVRDIKAQLQTLQLRIVGNGVQIGGVLFQCFQDVKTWVVSRFQIKRYGLFGSPFWISSLPE